MGITYTSKKDKGKNFDVNYSGADLLGLFHKYIGAPLYDSRLPCDHRSPRVPYSAGHEVSMSIAEKIREATDFKIKIFYEDPKIRSLFEGTPDEFVGWVRDWQEFLETCGGYEAD